MKHLFAFIFGLATMLLVARGATLTWEPTPGTNIAGYKLYWKSSTNFTYFTTNVVGQQNTNVTIPSVPYLVYQAYVTSYTFDEFESDPSNMVRFQFIFVNGIGKTTILTLGDFNNSNFSGFVLVSSPTNGVISGVAPNVTFSPSSNFGNVDMFVYKSPEMWMGQNITNYYCVLKTIINKPPLLLKDP